MNRGVALFFILSLCWLMSQGCGKREGNRGRENRLTRPAENPDTDATSQKLGERIQESDPFPWENGAKDKGGGAIKKPGRDGETNRGEAAHLVFESNYQKGIKLCSEKKYTEAIPLFENILRSNPGSMEASMAQYRIAEAYFDFKNNDQAIQEFEKLLKDFPQSPAAPNARAALEYLKQIKGHQAAFISPEDERERGLR